MNYGQQGQHPNMNLNYVALQNNYFFTGMPQGEGNMYDNMNMGMGHQNYLGQGQGQLQLQEKNEQKEN